jgi:hypothetical protein
VPIVLKSGSINLLEPPGPVKACSGIALPLLTDLWSDQEQVSKLFRDAATTLSLCASTLLEVQFCYLIAHKKFAAILQRRNFKIIQITSLITKHSKTPLIRTLVIRIGLALWVNLSRILQN